MIELGIIEVVTHTTLPEKLIPKDIPVFELLSIDIKDNKIIIVPASTTCPFCGRLGVVQLSNWFVCLPCIKQLKKLRRKKNA